MMLQISFSFNEAIIFCMNTRGLILTKQYSTGLFVSHSTHGKTQLHKNIIVFNKPNTFVTELSLP
jgi:hypothetical protein